MKKLGPARMDLVHGVSNVLFVECCFFWLNIVFVIALIMFVFHFVFLIVSFMFAANVDVFVVCKSQ